MSDFKVGLMVLGGIGIFLAFHWIIQGVSFDKEGKKILTTFSTLNGIRIGSDVRVAGGLRVGKVRKIEFRGNKVLLTLWVKRNTKVSTTTSTAIASANFFGEKYISLEYAQDPGTPLNPDSVITGTPPFSITGSVREFGSLMRKFNDLLSSGQGQSFLKKIDELVARTGNRIDTMVRNSQKDLKKITGRLSGTTLKLNNLIKEYQGSGKAVRKLLSSLNANSSSLQKNLPATLNSLKRITAGLARALEGSNKEKTVLHMLTSDRKAYYDIMFILENLKQFTYKLRKNPSLLLWKNSK